MNTASDSEKAHILLVEDNPADVMLLDELLEDGYPVALYCTGDGHDASDFLHRRNQYVGAPKPDAILLDLGLPRVNGYELLQQISKSQQLANIPVIVLTTSRDPKDKELCMSLGAYDFISKPYNLEGYELVVDHLASVVFPELRKAKQATAP